MNSNSSQIVMKDYNKLIKKYRTPIKLGSKKSKKSKNETKTPQKEGEKTKKE